MRTMKVRTKKSEVRRVAVILFEDTDLLDAAGPARVFHSAANQLLRTGAATEPPYEVDFLSREGGLVRTSLGFRMETQPVRELAPGDYDTIIVSGGGVEDANCDPAIVAWLQRNHGHARRVGSTCTGAFVLAAAGLLDGHRAATHWAYCDALQASFARVDVDRDSIFVEDRGIWTSAGVTSGMDMALAMVEEDHGRELALLVARMLVVFLKRPGGQSQFSTPLQSQSVEGPLAPLLHWIAENPGEDLRTERLSERANMSLRNFYRAFEEATGTSPAEWVELSRIEIAKRLLEQTGQRVDQVAVKAGFLNYERMRRSFSRRMGVSPAAYRARFTRPAARHGAADLSLLAGSLGAGEPFQPSLQ